MKPFLAVLALALMGACQEGTTKSEMQNKFDREREYWNRMAELALAYPESVTYEPAEIRSVPASSYACDHDWAYRNQINSTVPPSMDMICRKCGDIQRLTFGAAVSDDEFERLRKKFAKPGAP